MIKYIGICLVCFFAILPTCLLFGHVRLPAIVSDSMILQRDVKLKVWGWADTNELITVVFKGNTYKTKTGSDGKWLVLLKPSKAGGPYNMSITGKDNSVTIKNVLIGDVWLCAGQSNMVHSLALHKDRYAGEIAIANNTGIRQFLVPVSPALQGPSDDITDVQWKAATPSNIQRFSVVAYFFAKQLYEKYRIPIGIINTSVGGSPIEAWTSEAGLKEFPDVSRVLERNKDSSYVTSVNARAARVSQTLREQEQYDQGISNDLPWYSSQYNPKQWNTINIPGYWEDQGIQDLDGIVWYRKEIGIPVSATGESKLYMGRIVNADEVYINGKRVGNTTYEYPQRRYRIPEGALKKGKNVIVIRVLNQNGKGGFVPDKPYYLAIGKDTIDLKGEWHYKVGLVYRKPVTRVGAIAIQNQPAALYNGMIAPFTNYAIKGVTWYQGESNTSNAEVYDRLLPALIRDWRNHWQQELPFLYAQLPNFMNVDYRPSESEWARLREAQLKALQIPNTAMAVTIDLGEWNDIHPDNKKPIGDRLALAAQHVAYNDKDVVYSGPVYNSCTVDSGKVILTFNHTGSGLMSADGEPLRWFAVAGDNKKFFWAKAIIRNNQVIISCKDVPDPMYVRYAWADNPDHVNFYNNEGLPATPFQAEVATLHTRWHGKKAAVVLTYDDALGVQLDNVIPLLDSLELKATFYLSAASPDCKDRMNEWKRAAGNGHELGNHTWYHPCDGSKPGRSWVSPANDLSHYTTTQIVREIEMTNEFLQSLDGQRERTFAYTCGDMQTSEGSFVGAIHNQFIAMRGVNGALNKLESLDLTNVNCYVADESNADQLIAWADKAREEHALLVVLFHGVGGGHNINVDLKKHHALLKYLSAHPHDFWVTTMLDAAQHCIEMKKNTKN